MMSFACKNRANGVGVGLGGGFSAYAEMRKEIQQVLDFQGFAFLRNFLRILSASFPQT